MSGGGITAITVDFDACDPDNVASVRAHLVELYNAAVAVMSGNQRMRVRHLDRWTEYHVGNIQMLVNLYEHLRQQYPEAAAGLPSLSPVRGGPAYVVY